MITDLKRALGKTGASLYSQLCIPATFLTDFQYKGEEDGFSASQHSSAGSSTCTHLDQLIIWPGVVVLHLCAFWQLEGSPAIANFADYCESFYINVLGL